jgi:uncharacterized alkaline shock family protein YloU
MDKETIGSVSIAPHVLAVVASAAALAVPGVVRRSNYRPVSVERLIRRVVVEPGVTVAVDESGASVDLYLIFASGVNLLDVSRSVQREVNRAIREMVGINVQEINVHVDDVAGPPALETD